MSAGQNGPEIQGDVSFTLFELLHMEIIQYFQTKCSDDSEGEVSKSEVIEKLERLGFRVGQSVCELLMREETRHMKDDKESVPEKTMKFVAKRMWQYLFNAPEHPHLSRSKNKRKDVFVLEDRQFRLLQRISAGKQYAEHAQLVCNLSCVDQCTPSTRKASNRRRDCMLEPSTFSFTPFRSIVYSPVTRSYLGWDMHVTYKYGFLQ